MTRRQPRAKTGKGGYAPSMKGKDPRGQRSQPVVAEDEVRTRALQTLSEINLDASQDEVLATLNEVIRTLRGEETR